MKGQLVYSLGFVATVVADTPRRRPYIKPVRKVDRESDLRRWVGMVIQPVREPEPT